MPKKGLWAGKCAICRHAERGRIDYLLATGASPIATARKFDLTRDAVYRHRRLHISAEFRSAACVGPFASVEELKKLVAENGVGVLQNLRAVHGGILRMWLSALEAGDHRNFYMHTRELREILALTAKLSGELQLGPSSVTNNMVVTNNFLSEQFVDGLSRGLAALVKKHPQIRADVAALLRTQLSLPAPTIEVNGHATP